jgi:hypothetical protein
LGRVALFQAERIQCDRPPRVRGESGDIGVEDMLHHIDGISHACSIIGNATHGLECRRRRFSEAITSGFGHRPLDPARPEDSSLYEPIHTALDDDDPVWLMERHIELNPVESLQLFSGFRGSGKTTELFRLRSRLQAKGYIVLYADALTYLNPSAPVEISDLIFVLAGAFSDELDDLDKLDIERESFWARFANFLTRTDVKITGADVKAEIGAGGAAKAGLGIKAEFKAGSTFRQRLQSALSGRISELKGEADAFVEDGVKALGAAFGNDRPIVFIFDQLEQLRGNYEAWQSVIRSVQEVFSVHLDKLKLPYVHMIYSVPPWLSFLTTLEAPITILPTVHLWNNDADRTRFEPGWHAFRLLLDRRLKADGAVWLFGADPAHAEHCIDRLIGACGGHVRDLLRLFQEVVKRASALPAPDRVLDSVINAARRDLLPIAREDAKLLGQIGTLRDTGLQQIDERSIERLSNFLDEHRVIYFVNGAAWYDIHPLIRDEVKRLNDLPPPG